MINKPIDQITKADIDELLADAVEESRILEYKLELPGKSEGDKKEFAADVSAFANAAGGDLIYGIEEPKDSAGNGTGIPGFAHGLSGISPDAEIRRLESIAQDRIAPRLPWMRFQVIPGFPKGPVIVLRVRKSWLSPHMVGPASSSRFFSRAGRNKYPLDVEQIRAEFAVSDALPQRVRQFRMERLGRIVANEVPVRLPPGARVVLHLFPASAVSAAANVTIPTTDIFWHKLRPIAGGGIAGRFNFQGALRQGGLDERGGVDGYVQFFRDGSIEAVDATLLRSQSPGLLQIPSQEFERLLIEATQKYLDILDLIGITPPIFVMLSLIGVHGYRMAVGSDIFNHPLYQDIEDDMLAAPDVQVEDLVVEAAALLRPAFDTVWQAAGWSGSRNYDAHGKWVGP